MTYAWQTILMAAGAKATAQTTTIKKRVERAYPENDLPPAQVVKALHTVIKKQVMLIAGA